MTRRSFLGSLADADGPRLAQRQVFPSARPTLHPPRFCRDRHAHRGRLRRRGVAVPRARAQADGRQLECSPVALRGQQRHCVQPALRALQQCARRHRRHAAPEHRRVRRVLGPRADWLWCGLGGGGEPEDEQDDAVRGPLCGGEGHYHSRACWRAATGVRVAWRLHMTVETLMDRRSTVV